MTLKRAASWVVPLAILALAAVLRFWALTRPDELVFDELFYVRDAVSQLAHGFPTQWPDDDPAFSAARAALFTSEASYAAHPPLGKWIIGLGVLVFGAGDGWGWRSATAFAGVLTVAVTMLLAWRLTARQWVAWVAGFVLALDGVHVTLSRVSLLDGHLTLFIALGALTMLLDHEWAAKRWARAVRVYRSTPLRIGPIFWVRPWLLASAVIFGLAAGIKWSGAAAFAVFLAFTLVRDVIARSRFLRATRGPSLSAAPVACGSALQTLVSGCTVTAVMLASYVTTWLGWIVTAGGWNRDRGPWLRALVDIHVDLFLWHSTLSDPHPFASHPLSWPLALKPTGMFFADHGDGVVSAISPLPNLLITWGGAAAMLVFVTALVVAAVRRRGALVSHRTLAAAVFVLVGMLAVWAPWLLLGTRSAVFQFYAVAFAPFTAIALALALGWCTDRLNLPALTLPRASRPGRRRAVTVYLVAALAVSVWFWPLWSAMPVAAWVRDAHLWLPGWW